MCRREMLGKRQVAAPLMAQRAAHGALRLAHRRFQPGAGVGIQLAGLRLSGKPERLSEGQFGHETLVLAFALFAPAASRPGQHCAMRRQRGRQVAPCGHTSTVWQRFQYDHRRRGNPALPASDTSRRDDAVAPDQGRLEVGDGPGEPDAGDGDGLDVADTEGVADTGGVAERDGVGERLGRGLRDAPGERAGLRADGVGLDTEIGVPADWAAAGICAGRTRKYSASTPRNMTASTMVEVRGHLLMRHLRSRGRCRGRRAR
jgi:hypothetical protein